MTDRLRVVTLGSDAIERATYGGEQRSERLHRIFRDHAEPWQIDAVYLHDRHFMTYFRPAKPRPPTLVRYVRDLWHGAPARLVLDLGNRPKAASELNRQLPRYRKLVDQAEVVQFEHPFAYPFFERRLRDKVVIYSSHNVESQILADYFQRLRPEASEFQQLESRILRWENELVRRADLVITCTNRDAMHFRDVGARRVCVAPNGAPRLKHLVAPELANVPFGRYVLFASSAWRPNAAGLLDFCSRLRLPEGVGVVCAGGIADSTIPGFEALRANPSFFFTGEVDEDRLAALATGASAFIVPMLDAGGSNIKTAQALLSNKALISTPDGFRGFESFENSPGVYILTTPDEFMAEIARHLESEPTESERPEADALLWSAALEPAISELEDLIATRRSSVRSRRRTLRSSPIGLPSIG
jgi:hypothetical protein